MIIEILDRTWGAVTAPLRTLFVWLRPEPELWAVVERTEQQWLKTLSVHESREQAMAMWREKTGGYAAITVMPHAKVQQWNSSLELHKQWEGENGMGQQDQ